VHFEGAIIFVGLLVVGYDDTVARGYYMYIYSLRHFLTTKGALIDGDGYPPKNPKNDPKKSLKYVKIWSKLTSKKCQKTRFLMAKSTFSLKMIKIDQNVIKNEWKLTHIYDTKIGHNLTTKRGDSGSAGLLERKCVIIGALNLVTKIDTNWCRQQKITKIDQKSQIIKIIKIDKTEKVTKVTKSEKWESEKSDKIKIMKKWQKKWQKLTPPQKGQNVT